MNTRFLIFLAIVFIIVLGLVWFDLGREDPWKSKVFFGQIELNPTYLDVEPIKPA